MLAIFRSSWLGAAWAAFALIGAAACGSRAEAQQPNILWIIADDLSPDLGAYGYDAVETPNLDRLAGEGTRYTNAYATSSVCSASRSALITGMYQTTIGAHSHRMTGGTKQPLPSGVEPLTEYFRDQGYYVTNANSGVTGSGKTDYNFQSGVTGGMYDGFDWANRAPDQPFFAQVQIFEPHRGFKKNDDFTRLNDVTFPSYYPDHPVTRADWAEYLVSVEELDRKVGVILDRLEQEGLADDTVVMFFGDHGRPHVRDKQWLYDGGLRVPLIVRDPTQAAGAGAVKDDAVSLIDVGVGSLGLTGATLPSHLQGVDMFASDFTGREAVFAGRDRMGNVQDRVRSVQVGDLKLIRNFDPSVSYMKGSQESLSYKRVSYPVHTLLLELEETGQLTPDQLKFLAETRPEYELYDLSTDPEELNNLADDPAYAAQLTDLQGRLATWITQTDDAGRYPINPGTEAQLAQNSINFGTNTLANRGFAVDGDRTLELRWWEERLGVQKTALNRGETLDVGAFQAGGLPPNGGSLTAGPFNGGSGTSPSTGGVVVGIVDSSDGSAVTGLGRITGHLTARSGSVVRVGGDGLATTSSGGVASSEDFEGLAAAVAFSDGASTGVLAGWDFIDLAPSNGTATDAEFAVVDTARDGRWTQTGPRGQALAQTTASIDLLRENDTSGAVIGGALAIAGPGSGIDASNTVDVIQADLFWGDALGDGSAHFLDSKIVFGYQDPDNFLSLSIVKGRGDGRDAQIDVRAVVAGEVTNAFNASGTGDFSEGFPDSAGPTDGMLQVKIIHDSQSGFVFFEIADGDDPSNVFATATVSDSLLALEGRVGFGTNNDAGAWDNLSVATQSTLPATGLQILEIGGNFTHESGASLEIDLLSPAVFDRLQVAGNATLEGSLDVSIDAEADVKAGDTFVIVEIDGAASGAFDGLDEGAVLERRGDVNLVITYQGGDGNDVALFTTLAGDFNRDGVVDAADYLVWRENLGRAETAIGSAGDGQNGVDAGDLTVWRSNYGRTAETASSTTTSTRVPEPSSLVPCALLIATAQAARWRSHATHAQSGNSRSTASAR